jgi:hypothetical protein
VIELLWYRRQISTDRSQTHDACYGRSRAKEKVCAQASPLDASVTTKGRENRM